MFRSFRKKSALALIAAGSLLFSASIFAAGGGGDNGGSPGGDNGCTADCGFERGPDPTVSMLEARNGPFTVRTSNVSSRVSGFGGGTIHYPTGQTGTMGAIVVIPGYVSSESSIRWWGSQLASFGFVALTIDTNSGLDQPPSRARQINAALDYLISQNSDSGSPVRGMIDRNRLGVVGWSMGGGGTLRVASEGRISAAIPLAPWDTSSRPSGNAQAPTLIFACGSDVIAPVRSHASPFYNALPRSLDKLYIEISRGNHYCANGGNSNNSLLSRLGVSWMKLHLDQDQRYRQFICGPRHTSDRSISEARSSC